MDLIKVANETVDIMERGSYTYGGAIVSIEASQAVAVAGTVTYAPDALDNVVTPGQGSAPKITVTHESTSAAAYRLASQGLDVAALNFASARHPGGGFLKGSKAQEEDLARCSSLYLCLLGQTEYYEANKTVSPLYTDHLIYSPQVPFFRDDNLAFVEKPYLVSIITSPAPNVGALPKDSPDLVSVNEVLVTRARKILAAAVKHGHRTLVLGAWGCGVFRNSPDAVADIFSMWLYSPKFAGAFDHVVFAVYDHSKELNVLKAFQAKFGAATTKENG
jgi:TIGR02452 family protein